MASSSGAGSNDEMRCCCGAGPVSARRSGRSCEMHGTSGRNGGRTPVQRGRDPRIGSSVNPTSDSPSRRDVARRDAGVAAARVIADRRPVAVEVLRGTRQADKGVEELAIDRLAGRVRRVVDRLLERGHRVQAQALGDRGDVTEELRQVRREPRQRPDGRIELVEQRGKLGRRDQPASLLEHRDRELERLRRRLHAGPRFSHERARGRQRRVEGVERRVGLLEQAVQLGEGGRQLDAAARERARRAVEPLDQVRQAVSTRERRRRLPARLDELREVVIACPAEGLRGHRALRERLVRGLPRLVERLRSAVGESLPQARKQQLEVVARVLLERREDLVQLNRRCRLRDRDRVPLVGGRRRRAARLQVDEEVALEEDARPHLDRRVLVDRQRVVFECERDDRGAALTALDLLHLADLDARDPHRRARPELGRLLHDRAQLPRSFHGAPLKASQHAQKAIVIARAPAAKLEMRCLWVGLRGALIRFPPRPVASWTRCPRPGHPARCRSAGPAATAPCRPRTRRSRPSAGSS